jgi:hypothetical protein
LIATAAATTTTAPTPPKPTAEYVHRAAWKAGVLATLNVLLAVIAIRFILLAAVAGAIVLTYITIQSPDPWRLGSLAIYALTVVGPCVWLSSR